MKSSHQSKSADPPLSQDYEGGLTTDIHFRPMQTPKKKMDNEANMTKESRMTNMSQKKMEQE